MNLRQRAPRPGWRRHHGRQAPLTAKTGELHPPDVGFGEDGPLGDFFPESRLNNSPLRKLICQEQF